MKAYSGAVLKTGDDGKWRILASKRKYRAYNPDHARFLLEDHLPKGEYVTISYPLKERLTEPGKLEQLKLHVLKQLGEAGVTEIDPLQLALTGARVKAGEDTKSYLFAVAPLEE